MSVNKILTKLSLAESQDLIIGSKLIVKKVAEHKKAYMQLKSQAAEQSKLIKGQISKYEDMTEKLFRAFDEAQNLKREMEKGNIPTADIDKKINQIQNSAKVLRDGVIELINLSRSFERI